MRLGTEWHFEHRVNGLFLWQPERAVTSLLQQPEKIRYLKAMSQTLSTYGLNKQTHPTSQVSRDIVVSRHPLGEELLTLYDLVLSGTSTIGSMGFFGGNPKGPLRLSAGSLKRLDI